MIGDGPDLEIVKNLVKIKDLTSKVTFLGKTNKIESILQKTDLFLSRIYKFVQNQHFLSVPLRFSLLVIAAKGAQRFFFFLHIFWTQKGLTDFVCLCFF